MSLWEEGMSSQNLENPTGIHLGSHGCHQPVQEEKQGIDSPRKFWLLLKVSSIPAVFSKEFSMDFQCQEPLRDKNSQICDIKELDLNSWKFLLAVSKSPFMEFHAQGMILRFFPIQTIP